MKYSLVVVPTPQTMNRLAEMTESTILPLDVELSALELATGLENDQYPLNEGVIYDDVRVKELKVEVIEADWSSQLVAYVESAMITARLRNAGIIAPDQHRWILKYNYPPGRSARLIVTTLIDVLIYKEAPFSFHQEMYLVE